MSRCPERLTKTTSFEGGLCELGAVAVNYACDASYCLDAAPEIDTL